MHFKSDNGIVGTHVKLLVPPQATAIIVFSSLDLIYLVYSKQYIFYLKDVIHYFYKVFLCACTFPSVCKYTFACMLCASRVSISPVHHIHHISL